MNQVLSEKETIFIKQNQLINELRVKDGTNNEIIDKYV
jgi:hypothetical protein